VGTVPSGIGSRKFTVESHSFLRCQQRVGEAVELNVAAAQIVEAGCQERQTAVVAGGEFPVDGDGFFSSLKRRGMLAQVRELGPEGFQ
jgi:hypothetical protein